MKRLVQFTAVLVVTLLAGMPTAEALTCPLRAMADSAICPAGMTNSSANCPIAQAAAANECLRDCCNCGLPKLIGPIAVRVSPKQGVTVQFVGLHTLHANTGGAIATKPDEPVLSSSPPRYILNRVFRI
jgi:hypothetical protein